MESAAAGVVLLILARIVTYSLLAQPAIGKLWHDKVTAEPYAGTATVAFLLGCLLPVLLNWLYSAEKAKRRAIDRYGNYQLRILQEATDRELPVSITLANGKVYVGMVVYFPNLDAKDTFLGVVPLLSGHRDRETLVIKFDTEYLTAFSSGECEPQDFAVVLSTADIKMLSFFDYQAMEAFKLEPPESFSKTAAMAREGESPTEDRDEEGSPRPDPPALK